MKIDSNIIKISDVCLNVNNKNILNNVSFEIKNNDFLTIIGPNGAGKTSLLKIILGIIKPTKGSIEIQNKLNISYVPQYMNIEKSIPVNVDYFLKLYQKDTSSFDEIIQRISIEKILKKQLYELSGGELQKVLLGKALLDKPDLLILDEPAQNLDISSQIELYKIINELYKSSNISILMVSHDLHMVMSSTKRVICLYHHICCAGEPSFVYQNPEFISIFGSNMSELISLYSHYHNHKHN